jgi:hypothetical protein
MPQSGRRPQHQTRSFGDVGLDVRFAPESGLKSDIATSEKRESPDAKWEWIADPAQGVKTNAADILITRTEVEKFEQQYGLFGSSDNLRAAHRLQRKPGPGVPPRYEWDAFYAAIARRVHEHGIPKTQAELIREMLDWFEQRGSEHAPDESTVRRKIAVVWRELNRA